jgi:hypothetical protein
MSTDDQTDATGVLWESAKSALDQQSTAVDTLRTRAIAMLSVAALVGGLFGSRLPHTHSAVNVTGLVAALALFATSVALAVVIGWPRTWYFGAYLDTLITGVSDGAVTLAQVNLSLTTRAEQNWARNQITLENLYGIFGGLCFVVGLQVVAWAFAVI